MAILNSSNGSNDTEQFDKNKKFDGTKVFLISLVTRLKFYTKRMHWQVRKNEHILKASKHFLFIIFEDSY